MKDVAQFITGLPEARLCGHHAVLSAPTVTFAGLRVAR